MWLVYALSTVVLTSVLGIMFQIVARKAAQPRAFSFIYNFTILVFSLLLVAGFGVGEVSLSPW